MSEILCLEFGNLKLFPSLNIIMREHFTTKDKRIKAMCDIVKSRVLESQKFGDKKVEIIYARFSHKLMDWDNFAASFKIVGDALVRCGVIKDDSPHIIVNFYPKQIKLNSRVGEKVVIKIREYKEPEVKDLFNQ